jgi:hypothetical protein
VKALSSWTISIDLTFPDAPPPLFLDSFTFIREPLFLHTLLSTEASRGSGMGDPTGDMGESKVRGAVVNNLQAKRARISTASMSGGQDGKVREEEEGREEGERASWWILCWLRVDGEESGHRPSHS